jgi:hypothetical protein
MSWKWIRRLTGKAFFWDVKNHGFFHTRPLSFNQLLNEDENMDASKIKCCLILHPRWADELPHDTFQLFVRSGGYVDCMSYEMSTHYIEAQVIERRLQVGTVKVLIPYHLVSAVILDPKDIIGFDPSKPDKGKENP